MTTCHVAGLIGDMADPTAAYIAAELRAERARRGLTQLELAERSGVSVWTVQRLERAKRRANAGQLVALAKVLDIEPAKFMPPGESKASA